MNKEERVSIQILYTLPDAPNQLREKLRVFKDVHPALPKVQRFLKNWNKRCGNNIVSVTYFPVSAEHSDPQARRMQFRNLLG